MGVTVNAMLKGTAGAEEKNARVLMAYHHPWTLVKAEHDEQVPHVDRLYRIVNLLLLPYVSGRSAVWRARSPNTI